MQVVNVRHVIRPDTLCQMEMVDVSAIQTIRYTQTTSAIRVVKRTQIVRHRPTSVRLKMRRHVAVEMQT